jgi:VWFA-related protein
MLDAAHAAIERLRQRANVRRVLLLISESRDRSSETSLDAVVPAAQTAGVTVYAAAYSAFKTAFTTKSSATGAPRQPKRPERPSEETGTLKGTYPTQNPTNADPRLPAPEQRVDILGGIGELVRLGKTKTTEALATATGGATFSFARLKGLEDAIEKLGVELHTQYVLSFVPEAPEPGFHRLEVRVSRRGEFRVRARPGYWSVR